MYIVNIYIQIKNSLFCDKVVAYLLNPFLACGDFRHQLITFPNSLDPDQDRQNVGPDLNPNRLTH